MLELQNVRVGYGKKTVLNGVSVGFERGRFTALIGVNGCGKTTLLKTMLGILPVSEGEVRIDGQELLSMRRNQIAKKISYLAQGKSAPDMTVFEMVLHGRFPYLSYPKRYTKKDKEIARAAMERLEIASLADTPLSALSGGMRQSAYIAMALAQDTDYILLDEPTTHLDISHQLSLMKTLRELALEGKGIVAVMHDLPMAFDYSDELVLIHNGKSVLKATPCRACEGNLIKEVFGVSLQRIAERDQYVYACEQLPRCRE